MLRAANSINDGGSNIISLMKLTTNGLSLSDNSTNFLNLIISIGRVVSLFLCNDKELKFFRLEIDEGSETNWFSQSVKTSSFGRLPISFGIDFNWFPPK